MIKKYLAVLGRLSNVSLAELTSQFGESVRKIGPNLAVFESDKKPNINYFGGSVKFGELLTTSPVDYLLSLDFSGKFIIGISDYSKDSNRHKSQAEAMKIKKILSRQNRSCRVLANSEATLSSATSHHNQMGEKPGHIEFLKVGREFYTLIGVQNITAYKNRDQKRPMRDAKVGMLPPKLAQILVNLLGPLPKDSRILDPFCGTGVLLQEAALDGFSVYGTDLSDRMVEYSEKNLNWLKKNHDIKDFKVEVGDATDFQWSLDIDGVACETYLGAPMSQPPLEIKLKEQKQECSKIILGFLKNISVQISPKTPLALAIPAWLRPNGKYERLNILDEITKLGYNVEKLNHLSQEDMLYFREGQIVAREIIVLRKK
ncbi:methyltransferase domain-containing protein [Candidatus Saccharibacteria bacterium]|nr:methyltransferase domain-containing protein [Candidatus Saccharibacteria bacterium]